MKPSERTPVRWAGLLATALIVVLGCGEEGPIQLPQPMSGPLPVEYPLELWDLGLEGETTVMVRVNRDGGVDSVFVDQSSGFEDFDSAAVRGGRAMRFTPAQRDGNRIAVWIKVPIRFSRDVRSGGTGSAPSGS